MSAPRSMFISGHSLTNEPIPSDTAAIADGFGLPLTWNRQYLEGSAIQQRSGDGQKGYDRTGQPIDAAAELARPAQHPDRPYDALVITEQHGVLLSMILHDTVGSLTAYRDRYFASNPSGEMYFYESWLNIDDTSDPKRWIAYERAAAPVWGCVVEEINAAARADRRPGRMRTIPAARALARLVERATQGDGLPGITQGSVSATVDSLFTDGVHLTRLGSYYLALVTFAYTFGQSPQGAWHPAAVSAEQAKAMQATLVEFLAEVPSEPLSLADCRAYVRKSFLWTYLGYAEASQWRPAMGRLRALYLRLKWSVQWSSLLAKDTADNPLSPAAYRRH